jgi:hypothetical protein
MPKLRRRDAEFVENVEDNTFEISVLKVVSAAFSASLR